MLVSPYAKQHCSKIFFHPIFLVGSCGNSLFICFYETEPLLLSFDVVVLVLIHGLHKRMVFSLSVLWGQNSSFQQLLTFFSF
ncbi:hypothetical protein AT246_06865 [Bartonella henselae]|nr:hypothetical protein AT247_03655 [Bartonella henselae]OLL51670.1 hypothetical protein AT243_06420 [Bartonella henselae]OLL51978.1 hypothetical protein AT241_04580 [Bartonella henselae]OLL53153.1 hypothetical protein AT238_07390 [Bartonella henselae]OLL54979.1 hypothetical protein AT240_07445 [Bartonella henselae]